MKKSQPNIPFKDMMDKIEKLEQLSATKIWDDEHNAMYKDLFHVDLLAKYPRFKDKLIYKDVGPIGMQVTSVDGEVERRIKEKTGETSPINLTTLVDQTFYSCCCCLCPKDFKTKYEYALRK